MKNRFMNRLFKYIFKYWHLLLLSFIFITLNVLLTLYIPILIGDAIDNIIGIENVNFEVVSTYLTKIIICTIAISILQWLISILNNYIVYNITKNIRFDAFKKIETLPLAYLDSHPHGELINLIITDVQVVNDGLLLSSNGLISGILTIIGTIIIMIKINFMIAIVVVLLTPLSIFVAKFISKRTYSMFKEQANDRGSQTAVVDEMIGNIKCVQALNKEDYVISKFDVTNDKLEQSSMKSIFFSSLVNPSTRFVNSLVYALTGVISGLIAISSGNITIGNLTSLLSYANQYTKPFNDISSIIAELQNAFACLNRIFDFIDQKDTPKDDNDAIILDKPIGNIDIENVYFSYTKEKKLIENFNLHVSAGQKIAIVGPTGCGKTTMINLLMRFYDVNNGSIKVDNVDIRHITRRSLHLAYGMVLQDTWLRNDTIRNNLTLNDPTITQEEIDEACKLCHCDSFIKRMPHTYDEIISDDTTSISTGQKQLLCIARVMLAKPKMLILDEATSNIDTKTEEQVQSSFDHLMKGKTSFVVAHRLSTILSSDKILVMKDGNIIEQGTHEELIAKNGFYTNLYNSQFKITK